MIDFDKEFHTDGSDSAINPIDIYNTLDRKSDVGPLRPAQVSVLKSWFDNHQDDKDVIVKLHTGEGKTLIGLLMLQSRINSHQESCLYLCPNNQLIQQVKRDAKKFGIAVCEPKGRDLPEEFVEGKKILVTTAQKLFNGLTVFGKGNRSVNVHNIVIDDSHACVDAIREAFTIHIKRSTSSKLYDAILSLFSDEIKNQGSGTAYRIDQGDSDALTYVPYWAWKSRSNDVLKLLHKNIDEGDIAFVLPLIENALNNCQCYITGGEIEILPYHFPVSKFGTFDKARQRILMSATTQDDSFFIKGLGFNVVTVTNPITNTSLKWSGEKMILLPTLMDDKLSSNDVAVWFSGIVRKTLGRVALVRSYKRANDYENLGALVVKDDIEEVIKSLKDGTQDKSVVIVNRYDGIDLPDDSCRILLIDGLPYFSSLSDRYEEICRSNSDSINIRLAQKVEQGLGRGVRGEKDYCCIILISSDLVKFIKSRSTNKYFSPQTRQQIKIGMDIADISIRNGKTPGLKSVIELVNQILQRDNSWKNFYNKRMGELKNEVLYKSLYAQLEAERDAEYHAYIGENDRACQVIDRLVKELDMEDDERGWYLQMMARFKYDTSGVESNKVQLAAYRLNQELLKPREGVVYKRINGIISNRIDAIKEYVSEQDNYSELMLQIEACIANLAFGTPATKFEQALEHIGKAIGFETQRPDARFKVGPDVLWFCDTKEYILFECKSEVKTERVNIVKHETGQLSNHINWFEEQYPGATMLPVLVHPTNMLNEQANIQTGCRIMMEKELDQLRSNVKAFFKEFKDYDINSVTDQKIHEWLVYHKLLLHDVKNRYNVLPVRTSG